MNIMCLLVMLSLSNSCGHRVVVAREDRSEFCLVVPQNNRPQVTNLLVIGETVRARPITPAPAQSLPAAPVRPPDPQRDGSSSRLPTTLRWPLSSGSCAGGRCSSNMLRRRRGR